MLIIVEGLRLRRLMVAFSKTLVSNITMRDVVNCLSFCDWKSCWTAGVPVGQLRRVQISNVVAYNADPRYASIISGIPGHNIEDVRLSNIRILYQGGGTAAQAGLAPAEKEAGYPEPSMFGVIPAYAFFLRHVKGVEFNNVEVGYAQEDMRPAFVLNDVDGADFFHVKAQLAKGAFAFLLQKVSDFSAYQCKGVPDTGLERAEQKTF